MATKRQRLKLVKPKRLTNSENDKNSNSFEEDCTIIDDNESRSKQNQGKYGFQISQTIKDERLKELRERLEIVAKKFQSSSFIPFPDFVVNKQKDSSITENAITFSHPQWSPFPSVCVDCATSLPLISSETNHGSQLLNSSHCSPSHETFSLFPCSFQTNQNPAFWDRKCPSSSETESPSRMKTDEIISSPDLFGQFSAENQKFQSKPKPFQSSTFASKILFPEISSDLTKDSSSTNQETISTEKPVRSCPLCQESFPSQMSQLDIDGHIAGCLSATADDDDIQW